MALTEYTVIFKNGTKITVEAEQFNIQEISHIEGEAQDGRAIFGFNTSEILAWYEDNSLVSYTEKVAVPIATSLTADKMKIKQSTKGYCEDEYPLPNPRAARRNDEECTEHGEAKPVEEPGQYHGVPIYTFEAHQMMIENLSGRMRIPAPCYWSHSNSPNWFDWNKIWLVANSPDKKQTIFITSSGQWGVRYINDKHPNYYNKIDLNSAYSIINKEQWVPQEGGYYHWLEAGEEI